MLGLTPTIVGMMDSINRAYGMVDNIPIEQTINHALDLGTPIQAGNRVAKAYMYGSDGRDARSAKRALPYSALPLIARPLTNPLTAVERAKYFFRKVVTVEDVDYEVYYAGRLPNPTVMSMLNYLSFASPTDVHITEDLVLPPHYYDWTNVITNESVIKLASTITIPHFDTDNASVLAASALMGITLTDIREIAIISGVEYEVSTGINELSNAICINHSSLDAPLVKPGVELNIGMLTGVNL